MIVAFTLPAMGHVKPMMPLLSGLVGRGHEVACFGHRAFEAIISATGGTFLPYPDFAYDIDAPDFNLVRMGADLIRASQSMQADLLPRVAALAPRLIVQDFMALWASRIGTTLGIPRIHTIPTLVFNRTTLRLMRKEDGLAKLIRDGLLGAPALMGALAASRFTIGLREAFGLEGAWRSLAPPLCELVFSLEEVQPGDLAGDVPRHYIGPVFDPLARHAPPEKRGYALITFGTLSNNETARFDAAIRGACHAGFSVFAKCGSKVDLDQLRAVARRLEQMHPGQDVTILDTVPAMEPLIAGADIVIHHAGMATTWETARAKKPALFIPTIADQKVLATQLERVGFGLRLPAGQECDASAIALALRAVQSRFYSWSALEPIFDRAGGAQAGIAIIARALESQG